MGNRRRLASRLAELLKQFDKQIAQAFLQAVQLKATSVNLAELVKAIEANDINRAASIAGINRADLFPLDSAVSAAYVAGGQTVAAGAPKFAVAFGFDGRSVRAEAWARRHVGNLVTGLVEEQVEMLRETIGTQLSQGIGPRSIATQIAGPIVNGSRQGGFIGLSQPQAKYLLNARAELESLDASYFTRKLRDKRLDPLVRKAIRTKQSLSTEDINRLTSRYSDRLIKHRAETIARTESITALRAGRREGVQQGIEAGAIASDSMKRVWNATGDSRVRPDHAAMDGKSVSGMEQPFSLPDGSLMLYPGDTSLGASAGQTINCRCYDEYVVDWIRG